MGKWLGYSALMAGGYFLAGRLGQLLAAPPNYATVIWPASGIALAGVLIWGYRIWPGLFLGALLVNGWTPLFHAGSIDAAANALLVPTSISLGATAQAMVGAFLIRRFVGYPNALIQDRQVLAFLALGGPLACMVGASCGVTSLALSGVIDVSHIALNWWTWWVGDVIGVIIFTPLMMICFARPRHPWRSRGLSVALPLSAAFIVTVVGFVTAQLYEQSRAQIRFEEITANAHRRLKEHLLIRLDAIHSLKSFYMCSVQVERAEFASFYRHLLSRQSGVQAIAWLPKVLETERHEHDGRARSEGLSHYAVTQRSADQTLVTAENREVHFPVFYLEPRRAMALHLGFDMASNPEWREAMSMCRDSGQQVATRPMIDEQGSAQSTILVFAPIYSDGVVPATVTDRRQSLNGFILSVFHVDNIVRAAFPRKQMKEIGLTIVDTSMAPDELLVYAGTKDASPHKKSEVARMLNRDLKSSASIQVAGRQWLCRFAPTPDFYIGEANRHNWLILASGVSLTALLGAFLLLLSGRTARIEASESRYLDLYDNAPDMFISIDMSTQRVIQCNQTLLEVSGFSKEDVIGTHYYDLFDRNSRADVRRAFQMFLDKGQAKEVELRLFCADGQFVDTSINVSAVRNEQGESIYCRATLRDITSKKRIERQIKEQELELAHVARLSMMGEMATGLAHEINQPLAAIAAYAEGAAIRIRNGSSDADGLARVVDRISADAHRAGEVIRRLRRFVRKREPERREVDMNELIREVAQFVGPDLKHRQAKLELDLEECLLPLRVDAVQIQQVLVNLVRNGCDAMEETQPAQRLLTIRSRANGQSSIDVDVEDYGHGVSESMDEQVFEPFFSAKKDGLGMGLAISRSIIELHGGQIWVTPNLQEGATFHFSLPATDKIPQDDRSSNSISG